MLQRPAAQLRLYTGPIDGLESIVTDEKCPACNAVLSRIPVQTGACHSGRFATRVLHEHYWCDACASTWVPPGLHPPQNGESHDAAHSEKV